MQTKHETKTDKDDKNDKANSGKETEKRSADRPVIPERPAGKEERRAFQLGSEPDRTWLTKEEAEDKGLFWKDEPKS